MSDAVLDWLRDSGVAAATPGADQQGAAEWLLGPRRRERDSAEDQADVTPEGIVLEQQEPSLIEEQYGPAGARPYTPVDDPARYRCPPLPAAVMPATMLPEPTADPAVAVRQALRGAGVQDADFERFERGGGTDALRPIAAAFGAPALGELLARLRYTPAELVDPPHTYDSDSAAARTLGVRSTSALLAPRLLLAIPGHFRELARRAPAASEAYALENLGWLMMTSMQGAVRTATALDWWVPQSPPFVAPFSSTLPALTPAVQRLILRSFLIDTTLDPSAYYARQNGWVNGPAGHAWRLETGAEQSADGPGRPFYPQVIAVPPSVATAADRQVIDQAWQQRLADADQRFGAGQSVDKTQSLRACDDRLLQPLNLMGRASFGDVRLAYLWPSRRVDRLVSGVSVLRRLVPTFEALFRAVYELGWNDLLFETMGAGCFRGIKHPPGSNTYHSAARRLSDHGYGVAIDVNYQENPQQRRAPSRPPPRALIDPRVVALFEAFHFRWGYCFQNQSDPHHFEYCGAAC